MPLPYAWSTHRWLLRDGGTTLVLPLCVLLPCRVGKVYSYSKRPSRLANVIPRYSRLFRGFMRSNPCSRLSHRRSGAREGLKQHGHCLPLAMTVLSSAAVLRIGLTSRQVLSEFLYGPFKCIGNKHACLLDLGGGLGRSGGISYFLLWIVVFHFFLHLTGCPHVSVCRPAVWVQSRTTNLGDTLSYRGKLIND
jgi:hypothetical protein